MTGYTERWKSAEELAQRLFENLKEGNGRLLAEALVKLVEAEFEKANGRKNVKLFFRHFKFFLEGLVEESEELAKERIKEILGFLPHQAIDYFRVVREREREIRTFEMNAAAISATYKAQTPCDLMPLLSSFKYYLEFMKEGK